MKSGIYYILNITNNKVYIGQSKNIVARLKEHKRDLKAFRHINWHLQKSYEKYGDSNFEYGVLEFCDIDKLDEKEIHYIKSLGSMNRYKGYNLKDGGSRTIFSQETLAKMSANRKALCQDESYLIQMSWARSELSEEQVRNIKTMLFNGNLVEDIANKFNATYNQVRHIKDNHSFAFVLPEYNYYIKHREEIHRKRNKKIIMRMYREGCSFKEIAENLNINPVTPYRVAKENSTIHDERCRMNNIIKSHNKRDSLVKTLNKMGYSILRISRMLKVGKNTVFAILNGKQNVINHGGKVDVYKYKQQLYK